MLLIADHLPRGWREWEWEREKERDEARICRLFSSRVPLDKGSFNWRRDREGERERSTKWCRSRCPEGGSFRSSQLVARSRITAPPRRQAFRRGVSCSRSRRDRHGIVAGISLMAGAWREENWTMEGWTDGWRRNWFTGTRVCVFVYEASVVGQEESFEFRPLSAYEIPDLESGWWNIGREHGGSFRLTIRVETLVSLFIHWKFFDGEITSFGIFFVLSSWVINS